MEEWKDILGYEDKYQVSNTGKVRSMHYNKTKGLIKEVKYFLAGYGYRTISLWKNNKNRKRSIHILVLETFGSPRPEGMQVCHINGDRFNNHIDNLKWDTPLNNTREKVKHGTQFRGEQTPNSKLKEKDILKIYKLSNMGFTHNLIAKCFMVGQAQISRIIKGTRWNHMHHLMKAI